MTLWSKQRCAGMVCFLLVNIFQPGFGTAQDQGIGDSILSAAIGSTWFYGNGFGGTFKDQQFSIQSDIALQRFQQHTQWNLNYDALIGVNQLESETTKQTTQALTAGLQHDFTRRLSLNLKESYSLTDNPFLVTQPNATAPVVQISSQAGSFAAPLAKEVGNDVEGDLVYETGPHSSVGLSGIDSIRHFRSTLMDVALIDTNTVTGSAYFSRQLDRRNNIGFSYQVSDIKFEGDTAHTSNQTLSLRDDLTIGKNTTFSLFVGPEYSQTHGTILLAPNLSKTLQPASVSYWFTSTGSAITWHGATTNMNLEWRRSVSGGGGFASAVRLNSLNASISKNWGNRWYANGQVNYSTGALIQGTTASGAGAITTTECGIWITRVLRPNLTAWSGYARVWFSTGISNSLFPGNYNLTEAGLTYRFVRRPW